MTIEQFEIEEIGGHTTTIGAELREIARGSYLRKITVEDCKKHFHEKELKMLEVMTGSHLADRAPEAVGLLAEQYLRQRNFVPTASPYLVAEIVPQWAHVRLWYATGRNIYELEGHRVRPGDI